MSQPEPLRFRPIDLTGVYLLVVDDYEDTLELFRSALEALGAEVVTARSARDALTIIKITPWNTLGTNLRIPGRAGHGFFRHLAHCSSSKRGFTRATRTKP